jgi:glycosyl transferase family 21
MLATRPKPSSAPTPLVLPAGSDLTYVLPVRKDSVDDVSDLAGYIGWLATQADVIVVDGSPPQVFAHLGRFLPHGVRHTAPSPDLETLNGKVAGVLTGLAQAATERVIIADDDVRYNEEALTQLARLLEIADVVRPRTTFRRCPGTPAGIPPGP